MVDMSKRKVFWHEAFFEAMKLELHSYKDVLDFVSEYPLSKEALVKQQGLDMRNVYLDRLRQANIKAFKEVLSMNESWREMVMEIAEETGWLERREREIREATSRQTARLLLGFGIPIEQISTATKLTVEEVMKLASETNESFFA